MATAQLAPIARDFKIADVPVSILGLTLPALTFALSIDRALNGITRPLFGWISDRIGRENTMFIAFSIEAVGILLLSRYGQDPLAFVVLSGLVFFAWGEIYSLFPATCCDTYGTRYAAANAGLLYTAKGTAALLVPLTSMLSARKRRMAHCVSARQRHELRRRDVSLGRAQTVTRQNESCSSGCLGLHSSSISLLCRRDCGVRYEDRGCRGRGHRRVSGCQTIRRGRGSHFHRPWTKPGGHPVQWTEVDRRGRRGASYYDCAAQSRRRATQARTTSCCSLSRRIKLRR